MYNHYNPYPVLWRRIGACLFNNLREFLHNKEYTVQVCFNYLNRTYRNKFLTIYGGIEKCGNGLLRLEESVSVIDADALKEDALYAMEMGHTYEEEEEGDEEDEEYSGPTIEVECQVSIDFIKSATINRQQTIKFTVPENFESLSAAERSNAIWTAIRENRINYDVVDLRQGSEFDISISDYYVSPRVTTNSNREQRMSIGSYGVDVIQKVIIATDGLTTTLNDELLENNF